jgi:hypothetical protein
MSTDLSSQLYMLMSLSHLGMGSSTDNSSWRSFLPIIIALSPFLIKIYNLISEYIEDWIYSSKDEKIVSIKFPVHEVKVHKDSYGKDSSTRQLYSINYIAVNDYIKDNLHKINGISNLIEILNVCMDYYSGDTDEKNYVLIPTDSSEILIEPNDKIYCKIQSSERKSDNSDKDNKKDSGTNEKIKTYELLLFIKIELDKEEEKKTSMVKLNKFIEECVKKYNEKNEEKYEGKHWIYEYYHSYKDEHSGLELKFKEYLFENNKDLDTNIFFEGKDKLIKYVDKFVYNEEEVEKKISNKYEEEYKMIGYTYKSTFLFYGYPGCGKTSTIKAILNRTKRHGIIINWNKIKTCEELETIFRNRYINHKEYDSRELCFIIEDCDASKNNILLSRKKDDKDDDAKSIDSFDLFDECGDNDLKDDTTNNNDGENNNTQHNENKLKRKKDKLASIEKILKKMGKTSTNINFDTIKFNDDALNLACLLNILDGLIELHGVMVIFTTNYPEKLDEAFLRPGRIDFKQEFNRGNVDAIKSIVESKFKPSDNFIFPIDKFHNYVLSPAEIQSICFKNDDINNCIEELILEQEKNIDRIKLSNNINILSNN